MKLHMQTPPGYYIVGDIAFACGGGGLSGGWILSPFKSGNKLVVIPQEMDKHLKLNCQLLSY
jgi:hypothetical protein